MAQFFTDFSEYPDGDITTQDWTWESSSFNLDLNVESDTGTEGDKWLAGIHHDGGLIYASWDEIASPGDIEIVGLARSIDIDQWGTGFFGRLQSDDNYYRAIISMNGNEISIAKRVDGSFTGLANESRTIDGAWRWMRFRINGNDLKLKVWEDGTSEPETWDLETTDSEFQDGRMGVFSWNSGFSTTTGSQWDVLGVGTDGEPAPTEPVSEGISGTVTLDSNPVEGALVQAIDRDTDTYIGNDTTDAQGEYSIETEAENVHVVVEHSEIQE